MSQRLTRGIRGNSLRTNAPMTNDQLMAVAPSVFAEKPFHDRSSKYAFTSTLEQIEALRDHGFEPFFAAQSTTRIEGKEAHAKHMIRLRKPEAIALPEAKEIVLVNDSSGMTSNIACMGMIRFVCQNGLMTGSNIQELRVPHRGNAMDEVIEGVYTILGQSERVDESMDGMKSLTLTGDEQRLFAQEAIRLRWGDEAPIEPERVLMTRRFEDRQPTLWNVFNRTQENLIRGGLYGRTKTNRNMTTRPINSVDESVRVNRGLWDLADDFRLFRESKSLERELSAI